MFIITEGLHACVELFLYRVLNAHNALADQNLNPKVMRWTQFALADQNLNPKVMKWTQFALADQNLNARGG